MKNILLFCLSFSTITLSINGYGQDKNKKPSTNSVFEVCQSQIVGCNLLATLPQSSLICSNSSITYQAPVGNSCVDGALNTNWGCIFGRNNQTWFYVTATTSGPIQFNFTNSSNFDVDGIVWGPIVGGNLANACTLTESSAIGCDYRSDANVQLPLGGTINAQAGDVFILCILNFENASTNVLISQPTGGSVQYCMAPPVTQNCVFADCNSSTNCGIAPTLAFPAIDYLCQQQIIKGYTPQIPSTNRILSPGPSLSTNILRIDLAKITTLSLLDFNERVAFANNPTGSTFIAENFPVPFVDLQLGSSNSDSVRYAKTLSYLQYADGQSPFDRNLINFNPNESITRALVLKVMLEAWNIDEYAIDNVAPMPFIDAGLGTHPQYRYIKKAYELGIINGAVNSLFNPNDLCSREDAFLWLYKIMTSSNITKPTLAQINAGFFKPGQFRPDNLSVGVGTDRGNFNHYTKTSFAIDGVVPLVFAHSYNSYTTELPSEIFPNYLGRGWTHSFNCYIVLSPATTNTVTRRIVHYPDGKLHYYKQNANSTWTCESIGVYDTMTDGIGFIEITTPSKIVYRFESVSGQTNTKIKLVKSIKDRNNNTLNFTNELGFGGTPRLKAVADATGRTMNFVYKASTNWLTEVNLTGVGTFSGRKITFDYHTLAIDGDGLPDLKEYKEPDLTGVLKTTSYGYFAYTDSTAHLLKTITLPKGNIINNTYEQRKLKSSQTLNGSTVVQQMNTNWTPTYSASGQTSTSAVSVVANGVTKTTNYSHNSNGLAQSINSTGSNPVNLSMDYGLSADPTSVTKITQNHGSSSTGVRVEYYNTAPYNVKLVKTAKALGDSITQSYMYNAFNDISSFTNGRGFTTTFNYNATGNLTQINHPLGQSTAMLRNGNGTISKVTTPANVVTNFTYNTYGNLLTTSTPNGSNPAITTSATYDALSRVVSKTDARNQTVTYDYFANDLLKKMNAPLNYYVEYNYDANDNNTTVTNAKGNATTNVFHPQTDQLTSRTFGSKTESFTYNEDGSLKTYTNGRNQVFTFTYDPSGRITNDSYAAYTYNDDGTLNTVAHTQGSKTYTLDYDYDALKRLNKTTCDGFIVQYRYDNNNNLDLLTYPDGKTVTYTYDQKDRISTITDWAARTTTYTYDDDGKVLTCTNPNGTLVSYTYDAAGRPTGISTKKSNNDIICSYTFALDQGGNHTEENIVEPFTNLPTLVNSTTNYTTDARNQTTVAGTNNYTFDGNGATTSQAGQIISWDSKDNLLKRNGVTYYYDGNETRRAKTGKRYVINELSNSVLVETNDAGTALYYYVYGPTGLLYRQSAAGVVEYYHYDFRGSTVAMTNAAQTVVRQYQYDAYGKILQQTPTATSDDNPFRYVGQYGVQYESENLYFMRARYYDPSIGKFLSEDPIWNSNLFAYGDNNPIMNIDATGKWASMVIKGNNYDEQNFADTHAHITAFVIGMNPKLLPFDFNQLDNASDYTDTFQGESDSYMHAMTGPNQTCIEAVNLSNMFIRDNLIKYITSENAFEATFNLGMALHTIQDYYSPEHGFKAWHEDDGISHAYHETIDGYTDLINLNKAQNATKDFLNGANGLRELYSKKPNAVLEGVSAWNKFDPFTICTCKPK